jgi:MFS family permease
MTLIDLRQSIFFVGYILTQIPTNMILKKTRPSLFLPAVMCCWAVVSASCGAAQSYGGWVALRFLLGFVEAPFFRALDQLPHLKYNL